MLIVPLYFRAFDYELSHQFKLDFFVFVLRHEIPMSYVEFLHPRRNIRASWTNMNLWKLMVCMTSRYLHSRPFIDKTFFSIMVCTLSPFNLFSSRGWGAMRGVGATGSAWAGLGGVISYDTLLYVNCDLAICSTLWLSRSCISSRSDHVGLASIFSSFLAIIFFFFFLYLVGVLPLLSLDLFREFDPLSLMWTSCASFF